MIEFLNIALLLILASAITIFLWSYVNDYYYDVDYGWTKDPSPSNRWIWKIVPTLNGWRNWRNNTKRAIAKGNLRSADVSYWKFFKHFIFSRFRHSTMTTVPTVKLPTIPIIEVDNATSTGAGHISPCIIDAEAMIKSPMQVASAVLDAHLIAEIIALTKEYVMPPPILNFCEHDIKHYLTEQRLLQFQSLNFESTNTFTLQVSYADNKPLLLSCPLKVLACSWRILPENDGYYYYYIVADRIPHISQLSSFATYSELEKSRLAQNFKFLIQMEDAFHDAPKETNESKKQSQKESQQIIVGNCPWISEATELWQTGSLIFYLESILVKLIADDHASSNLSDAAASSKVFHFYPKFRAVCIEHPPRLRQF